MTTTTDRHAWANTGLDIYRDALVSTRRCVRCDLRQVRTYGKPHASWRTELDR